MIDLTPIANAVIMLIAALITTFLVPWIKGKVDEQKLAQIQRWVEIAVGAAEQIYKESGMGAKKKEYVLDFLAKKNVKLDLDSIDALIEEAVFNIQ